MFHWRVKLIPHLLHLDKFFELYFHFLSHIGCCMQVHNNSALSKILLILMCSQFFDPHPSPVQDVDDPVEHGKIVFGSEVHGEVVLHSSGLWVLGLPRCSCLSVVGVLGSTFWV